MISTTAILEGLGLASYCLGVSTSGVSLYTPVFDKKTRKTRLLTLPIKYFS